MDWGSAGGLIAGQLCTRQALDDRCGVYTGMLDVFEEVDVASRLGGAGGFEREPHERYADTRGRR